MTTLISDWSGAVARAVVYDLLARILADPDPVSLEELRSGILPLAKALEAGRALEPLLRAVLAELGESRATDLRRRHTRLFPPIESREHPTYETAYRGEEIWRQAHLMADGAGFYRAHGLAVGGRGRERPDHVAVQLEFLAFMARKEADALRHLGIEEVEECRRTQASFLGSHLGCWGPGFGRRLEATTDDPLYRAAGALLAAWLEEEMERLGVEPEEGVEHPLPPPPPDDAGCGMACAPIQLEPPS